MTALPPVHGAPTPAAEASSSRGRGVVLATLGVLMLSPDTLLIRLVDTDPWTIVFGRGILSSIGLTVIVWITARRQGLSPISRFADVGRPGVLVAVLSAIANLLFVVSVTTTHVANTLVIFSAAPLFAAVFSRIFLREHVAARTWWASGGALAAIALIFAESLSAAGLAGDLAAAAATLLLSANLTIIRHNRSRSMVPAVAGSGLISALVVAPFAAPTTVDLADVGFLALDGLIVIPLSMALIMLAPRYIPAPEVALIHLLETALGPLWVWIVLAEVPPSTTIAAGSLLLAVLAVHFWLQISEQRRLRMLASRTAFD